MLRMISMSVLCLFATMLAAQTRDNTKRTEQPMVAKLALTPLNVKTGLWQMTETITWTGLPPQMAAMMSNGRPVTYKSCVTANNLNSNPWADNSRDKCTWTALNSTGTNMDVRATGCQIGNDFGMTAEVHGKIHAVDSEDGTGSMDITLTGNGQTMRGHASYTGKWISASCPVAVK